MASSPLAPPAAAAAMRAPPSPALRCTREPPPPPSSPLLSPSAGRLPAAAAARARSMLSRAAAIRRASARASVTCGPDRAAPTPPACTRSLCRPGNPRNGADASPSPSPRRARRRARDAMSKHQGTGGSEGYFQNRDTREHDGGGRDGVTLALGSLLVNAVRWQPASCRCARVGGGGVNCACVPGRRCGGAGQYWSRLLLLLLHSHTLGLLLGTRAAGWFLVFRFILLRFRPVREILGYGEQKAKPAVVNSAPLRPIGRSE
jgi:hypothetical protein